MQLGGWVYIASAGNAFALASHAGVQFVQLRRQLHVFL